MAAIAHHRVKKWGLALLALSVVLVASGLLYRYLHNPILEEDTVPYLQMVGEDRATIRWLSSAPYRGVVQYGEGEALSGEVVEKKSRKRHRVTLTGLKGATRYHYRLGDAGKSYSFVTAPATGSEQPLRLWIQGDPGYYRSETRQVVEAAMGWMERHSRPALSLFDLWIATGDNAYPSGSRGDYLRELFNVYPALLPSYPYLPVYGNHDARNEQFFKLFSMPGEGELGGVPSGTEHYFSLDYGQLHLIFLDSVAQELTAAGEMARWLKGDLAANQQQWTLLFLHHPPYTRGSHDSDSEYDSQGRMVQVREQLVPIIEAGGVDMVLAGHSHVYERSFQLRGHYGASDSLQPEMVINRDNCSEKGAGTHYLVVGASAKQGGGKLDHPAMAFSTAAMGSLVVDIHHDQIRASYIDSRGALLDQFTIRVPLDGRLNCSAVQDD